jgi:predicted ATP-dependent endonuclease of OLD family
MRALLDVASITMSHGAVSLHDNNGTPIRQLGTGSTRLLLAGLQKLTSSSRLLLVDEAEYGLEPFRINRLLNEIGAKDEVPSQQVFITTHSPYVLRELKAEQLQVVRKRGEVPFLPPFHESSHQIFTMTNAADHQSTLRVCAEAFLANKVIVSEGKTEIGLIRGIDHVESNQSRQSIQALGVMYADGGGDSMFKRAKVFRELGYPVAIFKDSDKNSEQQVHINEANQLFIPMFEWNHNYATEHAIFFCCPLDMLPQLLAIAVQRKSSDAINAHIVNFSQKQFNLSICSATPHESHRSVLAQAAKNKEWFKDIAPMEELAKNLFWPNKERFHTVFSSTLQNLLDWARG